MRNNADKEINDLTRNIQATQAHMNDISLAIGRTYYAQNRDNDPGAEYVQMFNDMKAAESQIDQMQTRIKFLKGIVVCTNCKADNSVNSAFCANCGTRLPHTFTTDGANRCSRCGNIINPGQLFCGNCGQKVEGTQPAPMEPVAAQEQVVQEQVVQEQEQAVQEPVSEQPVQPVIPESSSSFMPEAAMTVEQGVEQPIAPEQISAPQESIPQETVIQETAGQEEVSGETVSDEAARFCPNCGAPIKVEDAMFCAECGTRLR